MFKIATVLLSFLERIAERLDAFYHDLASYSLYHPEKEANPARARWNIVKRRVSDGSFFVFTKDKISVVDLDRASTRVDTFRAARNKRQSVTFDQVLSQAVNTVSVVNRRGESRDARRGGSVSPSSHSPSSSYVPRLAHAHTYRADEGNNESSFEEQEVRKAANRMSRFVTGRLKEIRRLSRANPASFSALENGFKLPEARPLNVKSQSRSGEMGGMSGSRYGSQSSLQSESAGRDRGPSLDTRIPYNQGGTRSPQSSVDNRPLMKTTRSPLGSLQMRGNSIGSNQEFDDAASDAGRGSGRTRSSRALDSATFNRKLSLYKPNRDITVDGRHGSHW